MGYPNDILSTRAVVKHGLYAVIPPTGLVNNVIPGVSGCKVSIVASPKMGASFVQYIIAAEPGALTDRALADEAGVESFLYCVEGGCLATVAGEERELAAGGYVFSPAGAGGIRFRNPSGEAAQLLLYKQRYIPLEGTEAGICWGNANEIPFRIFDGMENVLIKDLLPVELGFDMNMHILSFAPGGCHPFVETHVQEHGAYMLEGEGVYLLDDKWSPIKKGDFVWFGPYVPQASYGVGRGPFTYIYSKDCNRDVSFEL